MEHMDFEIIDFVDDLVRSGRLEDPALGIAKKVVADRGTQNLSEKQMYVYENYVLKPNIIKECTLCCESIPYSEMAEALDNGGYCSHCAYMREKIEKE